MIAIQVGIIIFLIAVLIIVYQDENRKKRLARKSAKLNRFWDKDKERRKSIRINTEIDVSYDVVSGEKSLKRSSITRNISLGGMNLALNEKLAPGTILHFELNIPESSKPIFAQGEAVWAKEISEKFIKQKEQRLFATGVKFTQVKPGDEAILRNFINQKMKNGVEQSRQS